MSTIPFSPAPPPEEPVTLPDVVLPGADVMALLNLLAHFDGRAGRTLCVLCGRPTPHHRPSCLVPGLEEAVRATVAARVTAVPTEDPLTPREREWHRALMDVACQDLTDYDNAVTDRVADALMNVLTTGQEPHFGGARLNLLVHLIRDLQARAGVTWEA